MPKKSTLAELEKEFGTPGYSSNLTDDEHNASLRDYHRYQVAVGGYVKRHTGFGVNSSNRVVGSGVTSRFEEGGGGTKTERSIMPLQGHKKDTIDEKGVNVDIKKVNMLVSQGKLDEARENLIRIQHQYQKQYSTGIRSFIQGGGPESGRIDLRAEYGAYQVNEDKFKEFGSTLLGLDPKGSGMEYFMKHGVIPAKGGMEAASEKSNKQNNPKFLKDKERKKAERAEKKYRAEYPYADSDEEDSPLNIYNSINPPSLPTTPEPVDEPVEDSDDVTTPTTASPQTTPSTASPPPDSPGPGGGRFIPAGFGGSPPRMTAAGGLSFFDTPPASPVTPIGVPRTPIIIPRLPSIEPPPLSVVSGDKPPSAEAEMISYVHQFMAEQKGFLGGNVLKAADNKFATKEEAMEACAKTPGCGGITFSPNAKGKKYSLRKGKKGKVEESGSGEVSYIKK